MPTHEITCPLCSAPIPVPPSDKPNAQGLSIGIDDTLVEEHIAMHRACTCHWANGRITAVGADCMVHASPFTNEVLLPEPFGGDLFPDVLTTED